MKRIKIGIIAALLAIALVAGAVIGAFYINRPVSFSGTIVLANNLQVYSDSACTQILTTFSLGDIIHHGDVIDKEFWVKNIGEATVNVAWNATGLTTGITVAMLYMTGGGTLMPPDSPSTLAPNVAWDLKLELTVGSAVTPGPFSFTMNIYATA